MLLGIWFFLTIGWLGLAGYDLHMRWPEYYVFYKRPDGLLIGAMVHKDLTESLGFALVPPIVLLLIGWVVLWAVRGPRRWPATRTSLSASGPMRRCCAV